MNQETDENNYEHEAERGALDAMMKQGDAFRFVSEFARSKAYEEGEGEDKKKIIEFDASSDQEDLAGDVMLLSALEEMKSSAPGTIMLRDHNRSTEAVFGWITEAKLVNENGMQILRLKAEVDDEHASNVRIWKSISKGRKLGASVTVIVLEKDAHPTRKKSLIIKAVKLLEVSIVTIPCNQQSWTLAATASKALQISEAIAQKNAGILLETPAEQTAEINNKEEQEIMSNQNQVAAGATEATEATEAAKTAEPKAVLSRTLAAKTAHEVRVKAATESKTAPEVTTVVTKGLFADEQANRQPTLWDLFDILCAVKWQLMDRKWAIDWANEWNDSVIVDDYDYLGEYTVACAEFAEAAVKSFAYYGKFIAAEDASGDTSGAVEVEAADEDMISNALDIEKSFTDFAATLKKAAPEIRENMATIGERFVEVAKAAGIPFGAEAVKETAEPSDEVIRRSPVFLDTDARAKAAETRAEKAETELEVAKAGLQSATEVLESVARQPLRLEPR